MTISFQKYKKKCELEDKNKQTIDELNSINLEDALRGAIMTATGQNEILGVDYSLQREHCIHEAMRYDAVASTVESMIDCSKAN